MSDRIPVSEENQLDDMLLRSIETLLDENDQTVASPSYLKPMMTASNGRGQEPHQLPTAMPAIQQMTNSAFSVGNQTYRKWSNSESMEQHKPMAPRPARLNFGKPKEPHAKYFKRPMTPMTPTPTSTTPTIPSPMTPLLSPNNAQFMRNQALLAEQANHILHQYMQLNYEFLSAQATVLGIPLEQYIRNLLIATTSPPILMPTVAPGQAGSPLGAANLQAAAMQNAHAAANRPAANRMPFNKRQN